MRGYLRRYVWELLGTGLTLLCLWLALRGTHLSEVLAVLTRADSRLILLALVFDALIYAATAARWRLLFHPHHAPPLRQLLAGLLLAQLANTLLPAKLGPLVRAAYVGEVGRISKIFVFATVLGEKVWEGLTLLLAFALVAPFVPLPEWLSEAALLAGGMVFALFVVIWLVAGQKQRVGRLLDRITRRLSWSVEPAVRQSSQALLDSMDIWRLSGVKLRIAGWSFVIWGITAGLNYIVMWALAIQAPAVAALLLLVVLQAGARVPSSPGNVGVFHYLTIVSLGLFGVTQSIALGYALILHALIFLLPAAVGALVLLRVPGAGRRSLSERSISQVGSRT